MHFYPNYLHDAYHTRQSSHWVIELSNVFIFLKYALLIIKITDLLIRIEDNFEKDN